MTTMTAVECSNIDIERWKKQSTESVRGQPLSASLFELLACGPLPMQEGDREEAEKIAARLVDVPDIKDSGSGKRSTRKRPIKFDDSEKGRSNRIRYALNFLRKDPRYTAVCWAINPIREQLSSNHKLSISQFEELCGRSECVPDGQERIFAEGILHFLRSEHIQATLVLFTYLESSLRHFLDTQGHKVTSIGDDNDDRDMTLGAMLYPSGSWRRKLEALLSPEHVSELETLFQPNGGWDLRNRVAHGNLSAAEFSSEEFVYGVWIVVHLIFASLVTEWNIVQQVLDS